MPMPSGGLGRAMDWSRMRGEAKQQELIGMTAEDDVDMAFIASFTSSRSTKAVAERAAELVSTAEVFDTETT